MEYNASTRVRYDKKWIVFLRRSRLFRHIPFVEFALAAGSMALGNVRESSDFDVIVGARSGRIFTARFFAILFFGMRGWRRKKLHIGEEKPKETRNKICLNHFVTEARFCLRPPHSPYWKTLYQNLVPLCGDREKITAFFKANESWANQPPTANHQPLEWRYEDLRYRHTTPSILKALPERMLNGQFGNVLEHLLRRAQLRRIERGLARTQGYQPRIVYSDEELEFHPDTRRIEKMERGVMKL